MSTAATILLSQHNEHWYFDYAQYGKDGDISKPIMVLEIGDGHRIELLGGEAITVLDTGTKIFITLMPDSPLYKAIEEFMNKS